MNHSLNSRSLLVGFWLLENIISWNIIFLFSFVGFFFPLPQAGLIDVFVFKNFLTECFLLFSQVAFLRHEQVRF